MGDRVLTLTARMNIEVRYNPLQDDRSMDSIEPQRHLVTNETRLPQRVTQTFCKLPIDFFFIFSHSY